jgi:hypothetical protein
MCGGGMGIEESLSAKGAKKREENPTPAFLDFYFAFLRVLRGQKSDI